MCLMFMFVSFWLVCRFFFMVEGSSDMQIRVEGLNEQYRHLREETGYPSHTPLHTHKGKNYVFFDRNPKNDRHCSQDASYLPL